jgi:thioredoxin-related protein
MKKNLVICLLPLLSLAQGIKFENVTFYQLLSKAKAENKIIFIDAYAQWCGPCKLMSRDVFTNSSVGNFYNSNFISVKIDMEKGEGLDIAKDYAVNAYPTLLYIDGNGKLLHKGLGYLDNQQFIDLGKNALNPEKQHYNQIEKFKSGNRDAELLYDLAVFGLENEDLETKVYVNAYLKTQKSWLTQEAIHLMYSTIESPLSDEFSFLQKNEVETQKIYQENSISDKLDYVVIIHADSKVDKNTTTENKVAGFEKEFSKFRPKTAKEYADFYGMILSEDAKEFKLYEKYALGYLDVNYIDKTYEFLNTAAWNFFVNVENKSSLEKALKWAIKSVSIDSNFYNNDTVANLYNKLGDKNNAKIYAEIAVKLGIEAGEDTSETEALLRKLK